LKHAVYVTVKEEIAIDATTALNFLKRETIRIVSPDKQSAEPGLLADPITWARDAP